MVLSKQDFEQAVRNECPQDMLGQEIACLDDRYAQYVDESEFCYKGLETTVKYFTSAATGKAEMSVELKLPPEPELTTLDFEF